MSMKSILIVIAAFSFCATTAGAQTWNEWFRQKKTQKKYLIQQIAALKVYLKYLKEGYGIAKKGFNVIGDIKDGNFKDHANYFESLMLVNPSIRNSPKVSIIISFQLRIIDEFRRLNNDCRSSPRLSHEEIEYVESVYENLLTECETAVSDLNTVITDNQSQLKDDERLEHIELLYEDMKDKYSFTMSFSNSTRLLMAQRGMEQSEVDGSVKLNTDL
jgi:hypothetical protein